MGPVARLLRNVATAAFATGARTAAATYLVLTLALAAYVVSEEARGGDLFPGAVFFLLTAPVSIPAILWLPKAWVNTSAFSWVLAILGPVGTLGLVAAVWTGLRRWVGRGGGRHS